MANAKGLPRCPYSPSCRQGGFPETPIRPLGSLCVRTAAKGSFYRRREISSRHLATRLDRYSLLEPTPPATLLQRTQVSRLPTKRILENWGGSIWCVLVLWSFALVCLLALALDLRLAPFRMFRKFCILVRACLLKLFLSKSLGSLAAGCPVDRFLEAGISDVGACQVGLFEVG